MSLRWLQFLYVWVLVGCNLNTVVTQPATPTSVPPTGIPQTTGQTPAQAWDVVAQGLEMRRYRTDNAAEILQAVRIDPAHYNFRVHYRPGDPLTIQQWQDVLPAAVMIVNANFFDPQNRVQGLLISDGVVHGRSYVGRGGTFVVQVGLPHVRSTRLEPYRGEAVEQAVQAFPMLVLDGQQAYTDARQTRPARRTIIGQDEQGRILVMVTPGFGIGLFDLSAFLSGTDIGFVNAFNLDGGGSTMLSVQAADYRVVSFDPVPAVLAVYEKQE